MISLCFARTPCRDHHAPETGDCLFVMNGRENQDRSQQRWQKGTKGQLVTGVKSGRVKVESIEFGPMDVKVLGDAAVVQGSHVEQSTTNGQRTRGEVVWMDVFANRGGKWVVVRSQSAARVEVASRARWPI